MAYHLRWRLNRLQKHHPWLRPSLIGLAALLGLAGSGHVGLASGEDRISGPLLSFQAHVGAPTSPNHSLAREPRLASAFAAAFGGPEEVIRHVGTTAEPTRFRAGVLVAAPFGPVLLSEGQVLQPRPTSTGKLAVVYLENSRGSFRAVSRFVPAIESGSMGRLREWRVRRDFGPFPVVEVHGSGDLRGSNCAWTSLLELRPEGPTELVTVPTGFDDSEALRDAGPTRIDGRITNVTNREFHVVYSGSVQFTDRYVRRGGSFVRSGGGLSRMKRC